MTQQSENNVSADIEWPFSAKDLRSLKRLGPIQRLSLHKHPSLTVSVAKGLAALESVDSFGLWCTITRAAMRYVVSIPRLRTLDVLYIKFPGKLQGFAEATSLKEFRANSGLSEADLLEISTNSSLQVLGAQASEMTPRAFESLLGMENLKKLDVEDTAFDDTMAALASASKTLVSLEVGATRLSGKGLKHLCRMKQLRSLDLWATHINIADLSLLSEMPALEYLSVGDYGMKCGLDAGQVIEQLDKISSLKRIFLDGIRLSDSQHAELLEKYDDVRYRPPMN